MEFLKVLLELIQSQQKNANIYFIIFLIIFFNFVSFAYFVTPSIEEHINYNRITTSRVLDSTLIDLNNNLKYTNKSIDDLHTDVRELRDRIDNKFSNKHIPTMCCADGTER